MNRDAAVKLATAGFHVFEANWETKKPLYTLRAARDRVRATEIRWSVNPNSLPAINVGKGNLFVIDLDVGHQDGVNGCEAFDRLVDEHGGDFPTCPAVRTPRGGVHLYLRQREDDPYLSNVTTGLPAGIDIRADPRNGFVIGPGAVIATGEYYEQIAGTPDLCEAFASGSIPEVPRWFLDILDNAIAAEVEAARQHHGPAHGCVPVSDKRRRAWALVKLQAKADELANTGVGNRNNTLNRLTYILAGYADVLSLAEVYDAFYGACMTNGYITSRHSSDGIKPFRRTFRSGCQDGLGVLLKGPAPDPDLSGFDVSLWKAASKTAA